MARSFHRRAEHSGARNASNIRLRLKTPDLNPRFPHIRVDFVRSPLTPAGSLGLVRSLCIHGIAEANYGRVLGDTRGRATRHLVMDREVKGKLRGTSENVRPWTTHQEGWAKSQFGTF